MSKATDRQLRNTLKQQLTGWVGGLLDGKYLLHNKGDQR